MTAERDKCGLSSLLPMSCRDRAENFARRLHSRLKSLGSQDGNCVADENSWLGARENSISVSAQPRHSSSSELFLDFGLLESPGSPEEGQEPEFPKIINNNCKENHLCDIATKSRLSSNDSDSSDCTFYDVETEPAPSTDYSRLNGTSTYEIQVNGTCEACETNKKQAEDIYESPSASESTPLFDSCSLSEESTLSLEDSPIITQEELTPDEISVQNCSQETDYAKVNGEVEETYCSHLNVDKDLTVACPYIFEIKLIPKDETEDSLVPKEEAHVSFTPQEDTNVSLVPKVEEALTNDESPKDEQSRTSVSDDEADDEPTPRVRRCSSLKTGKTPPGTPGRKKIVRFADVLGLDLADVRTFLDEIPKIPNSAYEDLKDADFNENSLNSFPSDNYSFTVGRQPDKILVPLFQQPGGQPDFLDKVRNSQVCLENAVVTDAINLAISGTVRVRNLDFNKSVHIRYSLDSWKTYADLQAVYVQNSCDGFSDKFSFVLYANNLGIGQRLEFAVRFQCKGCQYWDNNAGVNYCLQCLPSTQQTSYAPITSGSDWAASFY